MTATTNAAVRETTEPSNPIQLYRVYIKAAPQGHLGRDHPTGVDRKIRLRPAGGL